MAVRALDIANLDPPRGVDGVRAVIPMEIAFVTEEPRIADESVVAVVDHVILGVHRRIVVIVEPLFKAEPTAEGLRDWVCPMIGDQPMRARLARREAAA